MLLFLFYFFFHRSVDYFVSSCFENLVNMAIVRVRLEKQIRHLCLILKRLCVT